MRIFLIDTNGEVLDYWNCVYNKDKEYVAIQTQQYLEYVKGISCWLKREGGHKK